MFEKLGVGYSLKAEVHGERRRHITGVTNIIGMIRSQDDRQVTIHNRQQTTVKIKLP